jgi:hypothetical protein
MIPLRPNTIRQRATEIEKAMKRADGSHSKLVSVMVVLFAVLASVDMFFFVSGKSWFLFPLESGGIIIRSIGLILSLWMMYLVFSPSKEDS